MIGNKIDFEIPSTTIQGAILTRVGIVIDKVSMGAPIRIGNDTFLSQCDFYLVSDFNGNSPYDIHLVPVQSVKCIYSKL